MTSIDSKSKGTIFVLFVVIVCFVILWPKIFYPMVLSIILASEEEEECFIDNSYVSHSLHPYMRESMREARPLDKSVHDSMKVCMYSTRKSMKQTSKISGALNIFVPVYSIGIIIFFMYSALKILLKKSVCDVPNGEKTISDNANVDYTLNSKDISIIQRRENIQKRKTQHTLNQYGKDKVLTALKTIILEMKEFKKFPDFNDV